MLKSLFKIGFMHLWAHIYVTAATMRKRDYQFERAVWSTGRLKGGNGKRDVIYFNYYFLSLSKPRSGFS